MQSLCCCCCSRAAACEFWQSLSSMTSVAKLGKPIMGYTCCHPSSPIKGQRRRLALVVMDRSVGTGGWEKRGLRGKIWAVFCVIQLLHLSNVIPHTRCRNQWGCRYHHPPPRPPSTIPVQTQEDAMILLKCRCLLIWGQIVFNQQHTALWNRIRGGFQFTIPLSRFAWSVQKSWGNFSLPL